MNHWWQWLLAPTNLSAVASIASAFIALLAVALTISVTVRQIFKERDARKPNLIVIDAMWTETGFSFQLLNLGTSPIFVAGIVHDTYTRKYSYRHANLLILPGSMENHAFNASRVSVESKGEFRFFFRYGLTGLTYHRLAFHYEIATIVENIRRDLELSQSLDIPLSQQKLTMNLGDDESILRKNLLAKEVFGR